MPDRRCAHEQIGRARRGTTHYNGDADASDYLDFDNDIERTNRLVPEKQPTGTVDAGPKGIQSRMALGSVKPKIYHITHINNLRQTVRQGVLWSDAKRIEMELECEVVGMSKIKKRRLIDIHVKCNPGTLVGEYVPFYLCPRSIMLYILHMGNHPDLTYRGGQQPIVHLVADFRATVAWAEARKRLWAFSNCNAGAYYADFYADLSKLNEVNWAAVEATDFRDPVIKDGKQAEFLAHESFPWELVEEIGVFDASVESQVHTMLRGSANPPAVRVERAWYY